MYGNRPTTRLLSEAVLISAVANTLGDEWSVEVLLETKEEEARSQLPPIGFVLEQTEGGTTLPRSSTWDPGLRRTGVIGKGINDVSGDQRPPLYR